MNGPNIFSKMLLVSQQYAEVQQVPRNCSYVLCIASNILYVHNRKLCWKTLGHFLKKEPSTKISKKGILQGTFVHQHDLIRKTLFTFWQRFLYLLNFFFKFAHMRYYLGNDDLLGGGANTATPIGLYARLFHAFLVTSISFSLGSSTRRVFFLSVWRQLCGGER